MGLVDGLKSVGNGIAKAAKAVVAPVGAAAEKVKNTLVNVWEGFFGSPTDPGGTNWNTYSHEQLHQMLHTQANPGQVGRQSTLAGDMAKTSQNCASQLQNKQQNMPSYWRGDASESAKAVLGRHSSGWTETGEFAHSVSTVLDRAADALSQAQREMPAPIPVDSITMAGAGTGAVAGSTLGPVGTIAGTLLGATASKFGASVVAAHHKAEAVEVMQRYERTLRSSLDGVQAPTQTPPQLGIEAATGTSGARGGIAHSSGGGAMMPGSGAGPGRTTGSSAGTPTGRSASPSRFGGGGPANLDPSSARTAASTIAAAAAPPTSFPATGLDGRPVGGATPWRELVGRGGTPDLLGLGNGPGAGRESAGSTSARGVAAAGGRATAGAPGMFAPPGGARGRKEEDTEHHYKLPYNEKLFGIDEKPTPPVIGA